MHKMLVMAGLVSGLLGLGSARHAAAAPAKFFVVVRSVEEAPGVHSGSVDEARKQFTEELGRHPELTLTPPPELGVDPAGDVDAYKAALRAHKLRALELTLRILEVTRELEPPPAGKPFRVLKRGIRLSVIGDTLPDKIMAIGGDGDAVIAAEIRKTDNEEAESNKLLAEATKVAITQAVDMTVTKLKLPPPTEQKKRKK
jgi:hypothetical protein